MNYLALVALLYFSLFGSVLAANETRRVEAFLTIGDSKEALEELQPLLKKEPKNSYYQRLQIIALAREGDIARLLKAFRESNNPLDKELLEEVAWAIIRKANHSSSLIIRQEATLASFMVNDAKGISLCVEALQDPSEQRRLMALSLATRSRDAALLNETKRLLTEDPSPNVRLQAILTVGAMRLDEMKGSLESILASKETTMQEKMACVQALSHIEEKPAVERLQNLINSKHALLRQLACVLVLEHLDTINAQLLVPLVQDPSFEVRLSAIQTIGVVGYKLDKATLESLSSHSDSKTVLLSHWLCLLLNVDTERAYQSLVQALHLPDRQLRLLAASCLANSILAENNSLKTNLVTHEDPLIRLNLAMGLIWHRNDVDLASKVALDALSHPSRLSWQEVGIFRFVGPSHSEHVGGYARLPESEDLLLRLELYGMVATCHNSEFSEHLKAFLKEKTWGISGQAACLLIQEELLCLDELKELLQEKNREIALQAAFLLAVFNQDEEALKVLEVSYDQCSRQMKEYILYAIGTIANPSALPFLVNVLAEPFESLRISAARAILLSLYH